MQRADRPAHLPGAPLVGPSKRALWDTTITEILAGSTDPTPMGNARPRGLYGSLKMWAHLQRQGIAVHGGTDRAPHTTERDRLAGLDRGGLAGT